MRDEPTGLSRDDVLRALRAHWGLELRSLEYVPIGAGSYHWHAEDTTGARWFVTADDLIDGLVQDSPDPDANFEGLSAAFETARTLRDAGVVFVVAPVASRQGRTVERPLPEWSLAVFPSLHGAGGPGAWEDGERRQTAAGLIGRLHTAAPPQALRRWSPSVPRRASLDEALSHLDSSWQTGPLAETARELLLSAQEPIAKQLKVYDRRAGELAAADAASWVVTHGEPHGANFVTTASGEMHLIDWDTVYLAPRERDTWLIVGVSPGALEAYEAEAGCYTPDRDLMELFALRWLVADLAVYVRRLYQPHTGSADDKRALVALTDYIVPALTAR